MKAITRLLVSAGALLVAGGLPHAGATPPAVEITGLNVTGAAAGTAVVVQYRYQDADSDPLALSLQASADGGRTWNSVPVNTLVGNRNLAATPAWQNGTPQFMQRAACCSISFSLCAG